MTFDPNKPYYRRDERPAKIVWTFKNGNHFVVVEEEDSWYIVKADGTYGDKNCRDYDLINITEKIEGWLLFYLGDNGFVYTEFHKIQPKKFPQLSPPVVACKFISIKVGEGLG